MRKSLLLNPYATYATDVNLPGLQARAGQEYHYPWIDPEAGEPIPVAKAVRGAAPGWEIVPGWRVSSENGKRQQVFKLVYEGKGTGKYTLTPEAAAELSRKLDPATMKRRKPSWWKPKAKTNGRSPVPESVLARVRSASDAQLVQWTKEPSYYLVMSLETSESPSQVKHLTRAIEEQQVRAAAAQRELDRRKAAKTNPFWVTPAGSAIHHSPDAWAGYQSRHAGRRLPAQAEREADLEAYGKLAPGWSMSTDRMQSKSGGKPYTVYTLAYQGRDTGKFALDPRKAVALSWTIDPETGKRKRK